MRNPRCRSFLSWLVFAIATSLAHAEETTPAQWLQQLKTGKLSAEQIADVTAQALRAQADLEKPWNSAWGEFVEAARAAGMESDETWRFYRLKSMHVMAQVAPAAKRSSGLPISIGIETRTGNRALGTAERSILATISEIPIRVEESGLGNLISNGQGLAWPEELKDQRYAALQPGPQTFHYRVTIKLYDVPTGNEARGKLQGEVVFEETRPWELMVEEAPPPPVSTRPDPALQPAIEKSFSFRAIHRDVYDPTFVQVLIRANHPPTDQAYDVVLRTGGVSYPIGPVGWLKGKESTWVFDTDLPNGINEADLVLQPSARAATSLFCDDFLRLQVVGLREIWAGPEIVVPHVAITSDPVEMRAFWPPPPESALAYALSQMNPAAPAAVLMAHDRNTAGARKLLEQTVAEHPQDAVAQFQLGCVLAAEASLRPAMEHFCAAQRHEPEPVLAHRIRVEQRRLCAQWTALRLKDATANEPLGEAYEHGWGVGVDLDQAKRLYRLASVAGQPGAMRRLAAMYEHRAGATVHTEQAEAWYAAQTREWYEKAAGLGDKEAMQWTKSHSP